jgi:hypothetical protein
VFWVAPDSEAYRRSSKGCSSEGNNARTSQNAQFEYAKPTKKKGVAFGGTRTHATKGDYDLNVAP